MMKKAILILSLLLSFSSIVFGTTWYAGQSGDWNNDNTWYAYALFWTYSGHPQDGDIAIIEDGYTITVGDSNAHCDSLYIENYDNNTLIINSGLSLTIDDGIYVNYYDDSYNYDLYIKVKGTLSVGNNIYIKRDLNTSNEVQLYASGGTITVGGDIIYDYVDGPEWESYKEFDFEGASSISCTNFIINKTDDNERGLPEIYMNGSSQLNVSGNFSVSEGKGEGYKLIMEGSSQINIDGYSSVNVTSASGNEKIDIELSGTSSYRTGKDDGTLAYKDTIWMKDGKDISLKLSDDASYSVYGNQLIQHNGDQDFTLSLNDGTDGSSNDAQWNVYNDLNIELDTMRTPTIKTFHDADIKVGGNLTITQKTFNDTWPDLTFDLNDESGITVSGNTTVNFTATGSDNDLNISIDNDAFWKTTGNVSFDYDGNNDFLINLNQNADGSSDDAQFTAGGNITLTGHNSLRYFKLLMNKNSDFKAGNNLTISLSGNGDWEDNTISVADDAGITVGGDCDITHTSSYKSSLNINLYNNAFWTVGTNGHTTDDFTINYDAAYRMLFRLYDNSTLTIYGDLTLDRQNGDAGQDCEFNAYTTSHTTIYDDLILKNTKNTKLMKFTLTDNAIVEVKDDIDFSNAPSDQRLQIETWSSSKLYIGGNFLRNSSHKYGVLSCNESSTLYYNGTSQQQEIAANAGAGSDNFTYANVVLNNTYSTAPQFTMEGISEIRDGYNLKFTNGIVSATSSNYFKILDNATVSDASNASYVDGYIHKIGNDAFTFPVGDNDNDDNSQQYAPISISAPSATTSDFYCTYTNINPNAVGDTSKKASTLDHVSREEYWLLEPAGSETVNVTLSWSNTRSGGVGDMSKLRISHWNGTLWEDLGNDATTGTTSAGTITVNNVSSFSPFTIGTIDKINPLPIELLSFDGTLSNNQVNLTWTTKSEINNDYFDIQRSKDGIHFETIGQIDGQGNYNGESTYFFTDYSPLNGVSYYRLKQVDFDNTASLSNLISISYMADMNANFSVYPNPCAQNTPTTITISGITPSSNIHLLINDITGRQVYSNVYTSDETGSFKHILPISLLSEGTYIVSIVTNSERFNKRLIISK